MSDFLKTVKDGDIYTNDGDNFVKYLRGGKVEVMLGKVSATAPFLGPMMQEDAFLRGCYERHVKLAILAIWDSPRDPSSLSIRQKAIVARVASLMAHTFHEGEAGHELDVLFNRLPPIPKEDL